MPLCSGLLDYDWPKQAANDMAVGKRFGRLKSAPGYSEDLVFHSLRKTYATTCEQLGIPEGVAADILGHEKETMTYGLYSGGTSVEQKKEAERKAFEEEQTAERRLLMHELLKLLEERNDEED